jgi:aspartate aminotransferase-like enzyme/N-acyl-L-homoserine lactone synthetase
MPGKLIFKTAETAAEFDQIHRLNYRTFAEEVQQYVPDGTGILVDRFHDKNIYHIAVEDGRVLGMVAANDQPPFSVEKRLPDSASLDALGGPLLEIRLLALEPDSRHSMILGCLLWELYRYASKRGYSHAVISGITRNLEMYQRIGFQALGPAVGSGDASFVPMALSLQNPPKHLERHTKAFLAREARQARQARTTEPPLINLMPGPVEIAPAVRQAFARPPVSHRSLEFVDAYERTRETLHHLSRGLNVAVMVGSGTTANDCVAMHLRAAFQDAPGLVLVNGEFGERLVGQASRAGLRFRALRWRWGSPWNLAEIDDEINGALTQPPAWIWAVHLETSTGVLNRVPELVSLVSSLASSRGASVALDCVSSLGAVPLPEQGVWMSTGVSGKSLGAYAGLAFVFASPQALEQTSRASFPASMDVAAAAAQSGPQFTVASPLLFALESALTPYASTETARERWAHQQNLGRSVRSQLRRMGIQPLAADQDAAPCVTTFPIPSDSFMEEGRRAGFELGSESGYLLKRRWAQIATMGAVDCADLDRLFAGLRQDSAASRQLAASV